VAAAELLGDGAVERGEPGEREPRRGQDRAGERLLRIRRQAIQHLLHVRRMLVLDPLQMGAEDAALQATGGEDFARRSGFRHQSLRTSIVMSCWLPSGSVPYPGCTCALKPSVSSVCTASASRSEMSIELRCFRPFSRAMVMKWLTRSVPRPTPRHTGSIIHFTRPTRRSGPPSRRCSVASATILLPSTASSGKTLE